MCFVLRRSFYLFEVVFWFYRLSLDHEWYGFELVWVVSDFWFWVSYLRESVEDVVVHFWHYVLLILSVADLLSNLFYCSEAHCKL